MVYEYILMPAAGPTIPPFFDKNNKFSQEKKLRHDHTRWCEMIDSIAMVAVMRWFCIISRYQWWHTHVETPTFHLTCLASWLLLWWPHGHSSVDYYSTLSRRWLIGMPVETPDQHTCHLRCGQRQRRGSRDGLLHFAVASTPRLAVSLSLC